ncbi:MAG: recombination protein O N-terminal domain-containing protein [Paludibacteraceae bacterium]|nr:recombination protein O N-terminal domain-containing protein [Paludibacteraceae bacterium]
MIHTTEAIVLGMTQHSDNSSVVSLYTRENGRMQYVVYGHKWKSTLALLNIVEITTKQLPNREIGTLQTVALNYIPHQLPSDVRRQCIAMFIAEALIHTLRLPLADLALYDYLRDFIIRLDTSEQIETLPNEFMIRFSELLGYGGATIEELRHLKSMDIIRTVFS